MEAPAADADVAVPGFNAVEKGDDLPFAAEEEEDVKEPMRLTLTTLRAQSCSSMSWKMATPPS